MGAYSEPCGTCIHVHYMYLDLHFLDNRVDVQHSTVASADDRLVLEDHNLCIKHLPHVTRAGGVAEDEARGDILKGGGGGGVVTSLYRSLAMQC